MKYPIPLLLVLVGCNGGSAGPGIRSHEDAADATVKAMREVASIVGTVKDKATAEAAKPKLEAVGRRLKEIVAAVAKLGPAAEASKAGTNIDATGLELNTTMQGFLEKMQSTEIHAILAEPFDAVTTSLMKLRGMLGG